MATTSQQLAVFTRNYGPYLSDAADIADEDPKEHVTFRSRVPWVTAAKELNGRSSIPIYMADIDGNNYITFEAELHQVLVRPKPGDRETRKMLGRALYATKREGLWGGQVKTLYAIARCRQIESFPQSELVKHDGRRLEPDYRRSYAIVRARTHPSPEFFPSAADVAAPPGKVKVTSERIIRDTRVVKKLKRLYGNRCQYCGDTVAIAGGRSYSEGHHLKPLGGKHRGIDGSSNIIILCPNHHAQCDFGGLRLQWSDLRRDPRHPLDKRYVAYHNKRLTTPDR